MSRRDAASCGWLLDGYPRTAGQARRLAASAAPPDAVVVLDRPDALLRDFALGRCTDSATGACYHPKYAPPPPDVEARLVWRTDDTAAVFDERLRDHRARIAGVLAVFHAAGVPVAEFDNARSELETFDAVCDFLDGVEAAGLRRPAWRPPDAGPIGPTTGGSAYEEDVDALCLVDETPAECDARRAAAGDAPIATGSLLEVARRCNRFDAADYARVYARGCHVGYASAALVDALRRLRPPGAALGPAPAGAERAGAAATAVTLAPDAATEADATRRVAALVAALVADGAWVPRAKVRNELQDVRALGAPLSGAPLFRVERAAVVVFGLATVGCHVNGYVAGADGAPEAVWLARRALSKPT